MAQYVKYITLVFVFIFNLLFVGSEDVLIRPGSKTDVLKPSITIVRSHLWNTSPNAVPICKEGLMNAVAKSLGTTWEAIEGLLAGFLPKPDEPKPDETKPEELEPDETDPEELKPEEPKPEHLKPENLEPEEAKPEEAKPASRLLLETEGEGPIKLFSGEDDLGQVFNNELSEASPAMGILAGFSGMFGLVDSPDVGADEMTVTSRAAVEVNPLEPLKQALLNLTSPTVCNFFDNLIEPIIGSSLFSLTLPQRMDSTMTNLLGAYCMTNDWAPKKDPLAEKRICVIMNLVSVLLSCSSQDVFDPKKCERDSVTKPTTYLPDVCEPPTGPLANQKINMRQYKATFDFKNLRAENSEHALPNEVPPGLIDEEGFEHFLLFRACIAASKFTTLTFPCGIETPSEPIIPGWRLKKIISYLPEGSQINDGAKRPDSPVLQILAPEELSDKNRCQIITVIRGTASQYEWGLDLNMEFTSFIEPEIKAHRGFVLLSTSLMAALLDYIANEASSQSCRPDELNLIFTGHSLGGGMSQVLGSFIASKLPQAKVDIITFASPNVFNEGGVNFFKKRVNARNIIFDLDPIGAAPCFGPKYTMGHPRCSGVIDNGEGYAKYYQNAAVAKLDFMKTMGGKDFLNLHTSVLNFKLDGLSAMNITLTIPPPMQVGATHVCGYECEFSGFCKSDPKDRWECSKCNGLIKPLEFRVPIKL